MSTRRFVAAHFSLTCLALGLLAWFVVAVQPAADPRRPNVGPPRVVHLGDGTCLISRDDWANDTWPHGCRIVPALP